MSESHAGGTQAVDRAALLVTTVVEAEHPLGFADLAEECGLPRSTTSRLLTALERTQLLERNDEGAYVAGPLFWRYANRHDPYEVLVAAATPTLQELGERTGETVNLGVVRAGTVVHIAQVDSRYLLGTRDWTQVDVPPHTSAIGKVLYAHRALPPTEQLERLTPHSIGTPAELETCLRAVRADGYAITQDELELGLSGIAVPVVGPRGQVVAALGLSGPTSRLIPQTPGLTRLLAEHAERIKASLERPNRTRKDGAA